MGESDMKSRKDCFFGLHFDMHANERTTGIGEAFDASLVHEICREVKPDFIQVDSKGHPGYSSYPTKIGQPAPEIASDILAAWRKITKEYQIPLFAHYSGVWDSYQAAKHPEWAIVQKNGAPDPRFMSFFGDYEEKLLIPQLREIAADYGLDGAWIDGDCWCVNPDYSEGAKKAYGKEIPQPNDPDFPAFRQFLREEFARYVGRYIRAVKEVAPNFEITSNWCNTLQMPEDVAITDFISGDLSPNDAVDHARVDARAVASFGRPWDLMAWGFSYPVHYVKPAEQLKQEAAAVIMLGGGFQVYHMQEAKKTLQNDWVVPVLREVAEFCRERRAFCHRASPIHEVGVVYSKASYYHGREPVFGPHCDYLTSLRGLTCALLDNQASVEVLMPSRLNDLDSFSMLALSECAELEPDVRAQLLAYAQNGGTLFLSGMKTVSAFREELGISAMETGDFAVIRGGGLRALMMQPFCKLTTSATVLNVMNPIRSVGDPSVANPPPQKVTEPDVPSLIEVSYGKGRIVAAPFDIGKEYEGDRTAQLRSFVGEALARANRKLSVRGTRYVDVALMEKDGKTYLHLLNTAGEHRAEKNAKRAEGKTKTFDEIPPVGPIAVEYRLGRKPVSARLLPKNEQLPFTYENGLLKLTVDRVAIHEAIEISF